jgi:hypothetical protein
MESSSDRGSLKSIDEPYLELISCAFRNIFETLSPSRHMPRYLMLPISEVVWESTRNMIAEHQIHGHVALYRGVMEKAIEL